MFTKKDRSTFPYWFAHWCAFQMTALNLGVWKVKYLFHDIEKPFLKLLWGDYKKVQKWHRLYNRHHLSYKDPEKIDWEALIIDWECSRFTKLSSPRTAREEMETYREKDKVTYDWISSNMCPILDKLGL